MSTYDPELVVRNNLYRVTVAIGANYYVLAPSIQVALQMFNNEQRLRERPRKAIRIEAVAGREYIIGASPDEPDTEWKD